MKKILVIEDDWLTLKAIKLILDGEGYEVVMAQDGVQGLELYSQSHFDLVITDILMPNKNGIEMISQIRKDRKDIPILAISGAGQNGVISYLSMAELVGANETLAKPFCNKAFKRAVAACFHKPKPQIFSTSLFPQKERISKAK